MNKYGSNSKSTQVFAAQKMLNASRPGPVAPTMLTHEGIAKHAYEIYVETGCRQGQSEQNWLQAEQELKNHQNWLQAGRDMKSQGPGRGPRGLLSHTRGGRP
jgi:hypothetical protein